MGRRRKKRKAPERAARQPLAFVVPMGLVALVAGAAVFWLLARGGSESSSPARPAARSFASLGRANVLLITIDTLRADRLGSYGFSGGLTPHLDRLASEGVRFERAFAHVPVTLPSHASLLTSRNPFDHGVRDNGSFRLGDEVPTLATVLKQAGYETGAFVGAFVLDARFGLDRGFDVYDDAYGETQGFQSFEQVERRGDVVAAAASEWIRARGGGPWLAWVHLFDPHTPYDAPAELRDRFPGDPYGAEIAFTDGVIGSFLDELREAGKLSSTVVLVLGDHGESLGDHGERTHGTFAYNSTLHVPWILWAGAELGPSVFPGRVRHVDVLPTVLDLVAVEAPAGLSGRSVVPFLRGERDYDEPPIYFEALNAHLTSDWAPLHGLVRDGFKYIELPIPELYDLSSDPDETENLYRRERERARRLAEELESLMEGRKIEGGSTPDRDTLARLRALGYVSAPTSRRASDYTIEDDPKRLIDVSNAYDEASDRFSEGKPEEALAILRGIVERQPRSARAHEGVAHALHRIGRLEEAVSILEKGVENGLTDASLVGLLGSYLLEAGRVSEAAVLLEDLVRREPHRVEARNRLGVIYGQQGRYEEARRELEEVLSLDPLSASTHNNLATLALTRGRLEEAARHLERALEIDPALASAHNRLAVVRARRGDREAAIESWKRAVELSPAHFDALHNLAMALYERSPSEARPYLERFVREAPPERYAKDVERAGALLRRIPGPTHP